MKRFFDTCSLLTDCSDLSDVILSSKTIEELENIKTSYNKDSIIKYKARKAVRAIKSQNPEVIIVNKNDYATIESLNLEVTNDNLIIACASRIKEPIEFYTEDYLCEIIAREYFGLTVKHVVDNEDKSIYKGYKTLKGTSKDINNYMENINYSDWTINEYLIIENTDDNTSKEMRFDGENFIGLKLPSSKFIKAKNSLQRCALDIMNNPNITIASILGGYGSGKTFLSMQMALYNVKEKGNQSKILGVREVSGEGKEIGFLPGTMEDKIGNFFAPLCQSLNGGIFELDSLKAAGMLETNIPFFMKGTTYNQTIILCDEAEDLSESQLRLIGTRLGENSKIYFAGDYKQSISNKTIENPLVKMCNEFKGNEKFACIYLGEDVRSETSKMFADLFKN